MKRILTILFFALCFYFRGTCQPAGTSLLLDGLNNYSEISDSSVLDFKDSLSIEVWINPTETNSVTTIISKSWCLNDNYAYTMLLDSGRISFDWSPDGDCTIPNVYETDSAVVSPFMCNHVVVVFDTSEVKIFINGIHVSGSLKSGSYCSIYNSNAKLRIGVYMDWFGTLTNHFHGEIDELRFWSNKISAAEINSRMNIALTGNEPGLAAYYDMEEPGTGSGFAVLNKCLATGGNLDGTSYGSTTSPSHVPRCSVVGVSDHADARPHVSIYPNPSSGEFFLDFGNSGNSKNSSLIIRNILSQIIFETKTNQQKILINLNGLAKSGLFFLEIHDELNKIDFVEKIIIE